MQIRSRANLFSIFQYQPRKTSKKNKNGKDMFGLRIVNWVSFFEANKNPKFFDQ